MHHDDVARLLLPNRFVPFRMHLSNNDRFEVRHPETAIMGAGAVLVYRPGRRAGWTLISLSHVVFIEPLDDPPLGPEEMETPEEPGAE